MAGGGGMGRETSAAMVERSLDRVAADEAEIGAFAHLDAARARAAAAERDREPARGPLHGMPVGIKDIIETADMPTAFGSRAYAGWCGGRDAAVVALLRDAGVVVLGKTVTTEFAWRAPGRTRNPRAPGHTPGGSSSGSAAAVAAGMVPLAIGTQTAGSVIRPAAYCGVVGFKPSFGRIPVAGVKVFSASLDTVGTFARTVAEAGSLAGAAARDSRWIDVPAAESPPVLARPAPHAAMILEPCVEDMIETACRTLAGGGARVADTRLAAGVVDLDAAHRTIMLWEAARSFAFEHRAHRDLLSPVTLEQLALSAAVDVAAYEAAISLAAIWRHDAAGLFDDADALIVPAAPGEAPAGLGSTGDSVCNRLWTLLHLPCVTVPFGSGPAGLPLGVQLVGRPGQDRRLLEIARWCEARLAPS